MRDMYNQFELINLMSRIFCICEMVRELVSKTEELQGNGPSAGLAS